MRRVLLLGLVLSAFVSNAQYKLDFKVDGLKDTTVYLLKYLGDKLYYADTTEAKGGKASFSKPDYPGGVYAFYTGEGYFEFIMSDQDKVVSIETSTENFIKYMNVKKSEENKVFYQYVKFIGDMKPKSMKIVEERDQLDPKKDKKKIQELNDQLTQMDKEVKQFQKDLVKKHEGKLVSKILKMSIDIQVPEGLNDTLKGEYLREHFWDNTDLKDPRLARSPVFGNKVEFYFQKMMHQIPDTIVRHASKMVDQIKDSTDMMKFVLNYVHVNYETSNIMGMDAVYVKMSKKYYCPPNENKAWWYPEENLTDRCEKATAWENLIIDATAPNLRLADTTEKNWIDVHKIPNKHKVMIFWDPDCGHCKKELPKLKKLYTELKEKNVDIEFIGIGTNLENEKWVEFIKEKELPWINISDFPDANKNAGKYVYEMGVTDYQSLNFRKTYDIFSTPQIYLLNKDNVIIGKRLDANNLARILERRLDITIDYKEEPKEDKKEKPVDH
ncbi:redoxin family protein [Parvicella tangerina]|uniref:Thiol-disulfide oxidoreductase ResA n=1 Tax=Parvicella tangerina TaxID=2829795 RepID=A0A916JP55_9FLAO|nr:redoxin family protein [Parvicella tangerina]CAG5084794.1 Thiol-disulfide oxidoreductase ResA [Parvicella tangerina]